MYDRKLPLFCASLLLALPSVPLYAEHGVAAYSGGSFATGTSVGQSITVSGAPLATPAAPFSFNCPITQYGAGAYQLTWSCAGGTLNTVSSESTFALNGTFVTGSMTFSGSGGGRGGHVTYWYSFVGSFTGTVTANGVTEAVNGSISQSVKTTQQIGSGAAGVTSGTIGWESAYSPLMVADNLNSRLLAADSITGAWLTSFGKPGSGTGEFGTIGGIAQDAAGRFYVTDTALNRVVRIDNSAGRNWIAFGRAGAGTNQLNAPKGIRVDSFGRIWIADSGNNRIVRIDDLSGTNWTEFGAAGTGTNEFSAPSALAFDPQGRIYVADTNNSRLVRIDDLTGKNWITLTELLIDPYGYPVSEPSAVEVDSQGNIYIATGGGYLEECSDMTGANPGVSSWTNALKSISLDASGTLFVASGLGPGLAEVSNVSAAGYFASALGGSVVTPALVYARNTSSPAPADAVISSNGLSFGKANVGEPTAAQAVTVTNIGAKPLTVSSITAGADYLVTNHCDAALEGGSSCTVDVLFDPTLTGSRASQLTVHNNGVHASPTVALNGTGTAPGLQLLPAAMTFAPQLQGTTSAVQTAILTNNGSGSLTIQSIVASAGFTQANFCGKVLAPSVACTIQVTFRPGAAGEQAGTIKIIDDLTAGGASQTISLSGTGTSAAPGITVTPDAVQFPSELVGTPSGAQKVTITNHSGAALTLATPVYAPQFPATTTCGATLAKAASCAFTVAFAPAAAGPVSGKLTLPVSGEPTISVELSGTGVGKGDAPVLEANSGTVAFGPIVYGDNPTMTLTISNPSAVAVAIPGHAFQSSDPSMTMNAYRCPAILAPKASCSAQFMFLPVTTTPVSVTGTLTLTEGTGAKTKVSVTGEATCDCGGN